MKPTITVLTTCYNHEDFIGQAIEGVIAQTYPYWKMIILDDRSTDGSRAIIQSFAEKDERISYYFDDKNVKKSARLNTYLDKVDTEYVAFLDSDDFWREDRLEKQMEVFQSHPEIDVCYSDGLVVDSRPAPKEGELWETLSSNQLFSEIHRIPEKRSGNIYTELLKGNFIFFSSPLVRHDIMKGISFIVVDKLGEDWYFWLDVAQRGANFKYLETPLSYYRIHGSGMMQSSWKQKGFFESREVVYLERGQDMAPKDRAIAAYVLSRKYYRFGDLKKAKTYARLSLKDHFWSPKALVNFLQMQLKSIVS